MRKRSVAHRPTDANVRTPAIGTKIPRLPAACGLISLSKQKEEDGSIIRLLKRTPTRFARKGELLSRWRLAPVLVRTGKLGQLGGESGAEPHIERYRFGGSPDALK